MSVATRLAEIRPARSASVDAFWGMLLRDLTVLRRDIGAFIVRTVAQPLMFVFVFTYVFPKIGQGVGGQGAGATAFSTTSTSPTSRP